MTTPPPAASPPPESPAPERTSTLPPRRAAESRVVISQQMLPGDANPNGFVHGGTIMKLVDTAAGVVAMRHARRMVATVAIDSMSFIAPVHVGDLVTVKASVNAVGRTSMEVGVRVEVENLLTGQVTHTSSAYLVMVAVDELGRPVEVPPLLVESDEERRRLAAARERRARREAARVGLAAAPPRPSPAPAPRAWSPQSGLGRPLIVGHRGAAGHAPENTLAGFELGLALGADVLECDVHLTRDGRLAVIHDHTVDRTTSGRGAVGELTLAELQALDAGAWRGPEFAGQRVPALEELLELARGRARVAVEVKQGPVFYPGIEAALAAALTRSGLAGDVLVISFDHPTVRRVRELCPAVAGGVLYSARPVDPAALARAATAQALMPHWGLVTSADVEAAHRAGLLLVPWTVNDAAQMARLLAMGVDGIASDHPDRLAAVLRGTG